MYSKIVYKGRRGKENVLIIMDLPIFVMTEWATLLVDIHCLRGGS